MSLLGNRFIRSILLSAVFLQFGIWIRNFAILLFVTEQTNRDPVAISLIAVAEFAPIFVFSFIGGAFADRWRPKLTMVWCDILSAASIFVVLLTLIYGGWQAIFFATLVSSILSQFSQPSGMKLFKLHVPHALMQMGMSMYQTIQAVFMILGPMLGTIIYFRFGIETAIVVMGICFLLSALALTTLPKDQPVQRSQPVGIIQDIRLGLRYVKSHSVFLYMGSFFLAAGLALGLVNPLGIFVVTEHLGLTEESLQWFTAVNGAGMIVGGMLVMMLSRSVSPKAMLLFGFTFISVAIAVVGSTGSTVLALVAQCISGLLVPFIHVSCQTMVMSHAEEAYVGRVSGILNPLFTGGMVLTMSVVGVLKTIIPLTALYGIASGLFLAGAFGVLPLLRQRNTDKHGHMTPTAAGLHHH